jgi:hypothetical protein
MDLQKMIEQEAQQFAGYAAWENPSDFNDKLSLKLYEYDGEQDKLIFLYKVHNLRREYLVDHKKRCNTPDCREDAEVTKELYFVEKEIKGLNPDFEFSIIRPNINVDLVRKNLVDLTEYPLVGKMYQSALDKLNEGNFARNLIDDLRLALELLLKSMLNNESSLENQASNLGQYLKARGVSTELRSMFIKLLDYYSKYQNEYVKHDNAVKEHEVDLVLNMSSSFIRFLLQLR